MIRILFIDDDIKAHQILKMVLPDNYYIISSTRGERGIELAKVENPDLILLDINLPDIDGLEVLRKINTSPDSPPVVMLTCFSECRFIVDSIKSGAADYIIKPFELEDLKIKIHKALKKNLFLSSKKPNMEHPAFNEFIGNSPAMQKIKQRIFIYASSNSSVLISGESGTGKELAAKIIHILSSRKNGPYIAKNCGAVPNTLFETEIFGSEKGAFTDAVSRPGCFEQADSGTLFLDEIGEMNIYDQVKILRILEEKELVRIGGVRKAPVNVRIICGTNKNLDESVKNGSFRLDLFYRINVLQIHIPPLRKRKDDIPILIEHFLKEISKRNIVFSETALEKMINHNWPGNIRELKNVIERAALLTDNNLIRENFVTFN